MSKTLTGSKIEVRLGDTAVFWATGFQVQDEIRLEETPQLDSLEVAEYGETGHRVAFTVNKIKTNDQALSDFGLDPNRIEDVLLQPELIVLVYDNVRNAPIYEITGVKRRGGTGSVNGKGVWEGSWSFVGRRGRELK
jgi:hypothetical protein